MRGFAGREVLAELLSADFDKKGFLEQALSEIGVAARVSVVEEKKLVTLFRLETDGRERSVAIGHKVVDSADPVSEIKGILRMHGLR